MHDTAVLIVGHGSREASANEELASLVASYRAHRPDLHVAHGYVELAEPSLDRALDAMAAQARRVAVVPLFLFTAGHVKNDVPLALAAARARAPHVHFGVSAALGVHPALAEVAFDRARSAFAEADASRAKTVVVVVGRGSSDPDANGDFCKLVRLVGEGRGLSAVEPTFIGITRPRVEDTLEQVARARPDRVVVVPYFLFAGRLIAKLEEEIARFTARFPWIPTVLAPHLGADERIFALLDERARQALDGEAPLPCDTCMYRTAMPGREDQVGGLKAMLYSVRHTLTHTLQNGGAPHVHAHRPLSKHVLVCGNEDCADRGSLALIDALRRSVKDEGRAREIKITRTSCMGRCGEGPTVAVYPDGVWYRGVREGDAPDLVRDHLLGDRLVARLLDSVMQ